MKILKTSFLILLGILSTNAYAIEKKVDNWNFELDADGMVGFLTPKDDPTIFINDWDVKAQTTYSFNRTQKIGAVYSIDADCVESGEYIHDAFLLLEDRDIGRAEVGLTYSIARKMGLGLPDVGYLRINDKSILYKKLDLKRVLISDTPATTGHEALRLNLATVSTEYGQYGVSFAGMTDEYDYAVDFAVKLKSPLGKLKSAYSLALSYMEKPDNYSENSFSPNVTADWRGQVALGLNLQYNSFIWGTSVRMIYDENPVYKTADGLVAGSGISYDLLQYSLSFTYLFSDTNIWKHHDEFGNRLIGGDYVHTYLASFRYKYSEQTHLFMSGGLADATPFFAVGLRTGF